MGSNLRQQIEKILRSKFKLNKTCTNGSDRNGVMYSRRNVAVQRTKIVFLHGTEDDFVCFWIDVVEIWSCTSEIK
jgi:hypothetical protein